VYTTIEKQKLESYRMRGAQIRKGIAPSEYAHLCPLYACRLARLKVCEQKIEIAALRRKVSELELALRV